MFRGFGSHGTTAYHAISIRKNGFDPSMTALGRAGHGCYFWAYETDSKIADRLAYEWWQYCKTRSNSPYDPNKDCRFNLFRVELLTSEENIFDGDNPTFMEAFYRIKQEPKNRYKSSGIIVQEMISLFQHEYRKRVNDKTFSYHVIKLPLSLPPKTTYNTPFSKGYLGYIVINKKIISISNDLTEPIINPL